MKRILSFFKSDVGRIIVSGILFVMGLSFPESYKYVKLALYLLSLAFCGLPVFIGAVRGILRRDLLDEKFLMSVASIGAFFVGEWSEGVAVMLFFLVGEFFEHKAVGKSRKSIRSLMDIRPDTACVLKHGKEEILDADEVEVGSVIVIRTGERIPIDSVVVSGSADVDTSAITGEAVFLQQKPSAWQRSLPPQEFLSLLKTRTKENHAPRISLPHLQEYILQSLCRLRYALRLFRLF